MSRPETETTARDAWSVSTYDLYQSLHGYRADEREAVVATVVGVEGSAYRRPGAMMLIDPGETSFGAVTAGCLESPLKDLAEDVLREGEPRVETFDLMDDDDDEWGLGLGCNGIIDILLEPLDSGWDPVVAAIDGRQDVATVTVVDSEDPDRSVGDRVLFDGDEYSELPGRTPMKDVVDSSVKRRVRRLRKSAGSGTIDVDTDGGSVRVFIDWIAPAPELLLFGSQPDINPVSRVGSAAGFHVRVGSPRGGQASAGTFPDAHVVEPVHPTDFGELVVDPERTYAVLMSHNLIEDTLGLASLLDTDVAYIGLMGPRERFQQVREELRTLEDRELTDEELDKIATPVGLDIGGGEPMHIALSIVSEAVAVHHECEGGRLKSRTGPIHDRPEEEPEPIEGV